MTEKNDLINKDKQPDNSDKLIPNNLQPNNLWYIFCSKIDYFLTKHRKIFAILSIILTVSMYVVASSENLRWETIVYIPLTFSILVFLYWFENFSIYIRIVNVLHFIQDSIFLLLFIYSPLLLLIGWIKDALIKFKVIDLQELHSTNANIILICFFALIIFTNRPISLIIKSYMQLKDPQWEQYQPSIVRGIVILLILMGITFNEYIKIYTPLDIQKYTPEEVGIIKDYTNAHINIVFLIIAFLLHILDLSIGWYFIKKKQINY